MNNYNFVEFSDLNHPQIEQVACLMFETGYYDYVSSNNKLNLLPIPFQIQQTLLPCAEYVKILNNSHGTIIGFFMGATKSQILNLKSSVPNWYSDKYDVKIFQKKLFHFYLHRTKEHDFILHELAIDIQWRGQGLFWVLYKKLCEIAKQQNCNRIVFAVWESKPALRMYLHCGAQIIDKIDFAKLGFKDSLVKCYFEI